VSTHSHLVGHQLPRLASLPRVLLERVQVLEARLRVTLQMQAERRSKLKNKNSRIIIKNSQHNKIHSAVPSHLLERQQCEVDQEEGHKVAFQREVQVVVEVHLAAEEPWHSDLSPPWPTSPCQLAPAAKTSMHHRCQMMTIRSNRQISKAFKMIRIRTRTRIMSLQSK
jgi:hypothetical protein